MSDNHAVFAVLSDGRKVRLTQYGTYDQALAVAQPLIDLHYAQQPVALSRGSYHANRESTTLKHVMVRSQDDPTWNTAPWAWASTTGFGQTLYVLSKRGYKDLTALGRAEARARGWKGRVGGWVHDDQGRVLCQGYWSVGRAYGGPALIDQQYHRTEHVITTTLPALVGA